MKKLIALCSLIVTALAFQAGADSGPGRDGSGHYYSSDDGKRSGHYYEDKSYDDNHRNKGNAKVNNGKKYGYYKQAQKAKKYGKYNKHPNHKTGHKKHHQQGKGKNKTYDDRSGSNSGRH
jgi:hypothetical protein